MLCKNLDEGFQDTYPRDVYYISLESWSHTDSKYIFSFYPRALVFEKNGFKVSYVKRVTTSPKLWPRFSRRPDLDRKNWIYIWNQRSLSFPMIYNKSYISKLTPWPSTKIVKGVIFNASFQWSSRRPISWNGVVVYWKKFWVFDVKKGENFRKNEIFN